MKRRSRIAMPIIFSIGLLLFLAGCSTLEKGVGNIGSVFSSDNDSPAVEGVYYTGVPDLPLYQQPGGVIAKRLPQYTKLNRMKIEKGYAHVRIASTGVTGWVENARLIWRLPQEKPAAGTEKPASQPAEASVSQQVSETPPPTPAQPAQTPVPAAPAPPSPANTAAKPSVAPSIFNPY